MLAYLFVVLAVAVRFMPHPWMFTPVVGSLLFFGARGSRRQLWIPFVMLAASDVVLTSWSTRIRSRGTITLLLHGMRQFSGWAQGWVPRPSGCRSSARRSPVRFRFI